MNKKLDNSLNDLVNCKQLALSTNSIDRMTSLAGMKSLEILSMGRNSLKRIEKLEDNKETLRELWLSYNLIASLDGLDSLSNLEVLYMSNNRIKSFDEMAKLEGLNNLRDVMFFGNPCYEGLSKEEYRVEILKRLPQVQKIDGEMCTPAEREAASA